jgi:hypothetical protein
MFFPEYSVKAGKQFQTQVRVKNIGAKDEESVKVTVSVPELGIKGSSYIDLIESEETESSEEIWLRVPNCVEDGFYDAEVKIVYDEGYEAVSKTKTLGVTGEVCNAEEFDEEDEAEDTQADQTFNVSETDSDAEKTGMMRNILEMALVALIIALVVIGAIVGFMKLKQDREEF